eukprot:m.122602 g.122602  ORF g.122602 m.122602 type:complete len:99 (+) comp13426_c0_seq1:40-336(+)
MLLSELYKKSSSNESSIVLASALGFGGVAAAAAAGTGGTVSGGAVVRASVDEIVFFSVCSSFERMAEVAVSSGLVSEREPDRSGGGAETEPASPWEVV